MYGFTWMRATLTVHVCIRPNVLQYWISGESCQEFKSFDHYSSNQHNVYAAWANRVIKAWKMPPRRLETTSLIKLVQVCFRNEFWMTCWSPLMQDIFVINTRHVSPTFHKADTLLDLLNGSLHFHISHPCSFSGCWLLIFYKVHVFHLKKKKERKNDKATLQSSFFFISKLWILYGPLILCRSLAV